MVSMMGHYNRRTVSVTRWWVGRDNTALTEPTTSHTNCLTARKACADSHHHTCMICLRKSRAVPVWLRRTLPEIGCMLCWADRSSLRDWNPADELIVIYIPYENFSEVVPKSNFRTIFVKCGTSPFGRNQSETGYQCRSQHGC
jgi:hypothetical protein